MKRLTQNILISSLLISAGYFAVTADYSSLIKNTGDTLTAASWNQLVDNVKGIQTDSSGNIGIEGSLSTSSIIRVNQSATSEYSRIGFGPDNNDMIFSDNSAARSYGGGLFFRVHDENTVHDYRDVMVMTDQGKVGIGSNDPQSRLHVHEKQGYGGQIRLSNTNTDANWNIGIPGTAGSSEFMIYDYDALKTRLLIDDEGKVGIGTTTPNAKLEIASQTIAGGEVWHSEGLNLTDTRAFDEGVGGGLIFTGKYNVGGDQSAFGWIRGYKENNIDGNYQGKMVLATRAGDMLFKTTSGGVLDDTNADMILTDEGRVGISNTNPQSKLAVSGLPSGINDSVADGSLAGAVCITNTGNMYIDTDGSCAN